MKITSENLRCSYCGSKPRLVDSKVVYGKTYGFVYVCENYPECDAYVGVHKRTLEPLGILANRELRYWKRIAHEEFDPIWRNGFLNRHDAYGLLADILGLEDDEAHIGYCSVEMCKELVFELRRWKENNNWRK